MSAVIPRDTPLPETPGTRYTRALVDLTRTVWEPGCTLEHALAVICEIAASAVQVERVNVWRLQPAPLRLACLHAYTLSTNTHAPPEELEVVPLDGEYASLLEVVRAIDAVDVESAAATAGSRGALRDYLHRHGIASLLDGPVRVEGHLFGVVCHEQVGPPRLWTPEEAAFVGSVGDYVAMAVEIDGRHRAEQALEHLRLHDATTDLPNLDYLIERVRMRLNTPHDAQELNAIVYIDIALPYGGAMPAPAPTVEEVMAEIAERLRQAIGELGELARVGANGFAVLPSRGVPARAVVGIAERSVAAVRGLSGWRGVEASAAAGVAFTRDMPDGDPRVLLRNAELAGDCARAQGRHRYEVFNIEHHRALLQRLQLEQAIRDALEHDGFVVHYQPEYDIERGHWVAAEALLRWRKQDGLLPTDDFFNVAEGSGLILPLGRLVLARACRDACTWPTQDPPLTVRVNVSAQQFDDAGLVAEVATALADSGLPPERLCLELTETALMRDTDAALRTMQRLKTLGVRLAIDDFGTGYSSLAYLKQFPINAVKIDRSFITGLPNDRFDVAIVTAVRELARALDIEVVAEGVEHADQLDALRTLGIYRVQGWLYSRALDPSALLDTLAHPPG